MAGQMLRRGSVIHDFPYPRDRRKCPHMSLISITPPGACVFACPGCYARAYPWSARGQPRAYVNLVAKLAAEIESARVLFPFYVSQVTDPLQPVTEVIDTTAAVAALLVRQGLSFHILTRSGTGIRRLLERVPELARYPRFFLAVTVEATPDTQAVTSPQAPPVEERLAAIRFAVDRGIAVAGRIDPVLVGLLGRDDVLWILDRLADAGASHIVASTGTYNARSLARLKRSLHAAGYGRTWTDIAHAYGALGARADAGRRSFRLREGLRAEFHRWLRAETERRGMTFAVCLELPRAFDSPGLPTCEGINRNFVHVRDSEGRFVALDCAGDCRHSCPDPAHPACGHPEFLTDYPYKRSSLLGRRARLTR